MEGYYGWSGITYDDADAVINTIGFESDRAWARELLIAAPSGNLPIRWSCLKPSPLHELLHHSDCDGEIPASLCSELAEVLEAILPALPEGSGGGHVGNWREKTQTFIDGLRLAAEKGEAVEFH
jgi:hypothetical protein